jgi:para-nitrobenzyl esterase
MGQSAGALDITLLMASPLATGLFEGAILESGEAQSTLNQDIRTPIAYNRVSGTGEASGKIFADDLGITGGPDALERLRSIPADKVLSAWKQDREVRFGAIVDGWVVPEQPAKIFAEGKQLKIPVLVGSNADEATVFGLVAPKSVNEYKAYLQRDTGRSADQEFAAYPAGSDAAIPEQFLKYHNDLFSYGAYSLAQTTAHCGQSAYLYLFTYAEKGKRAKLGAYHGQELYFLSNSYPTDWEHDADDERLGQAIREYWVQFAKTGNPNFHGLPEWPAYEPQKDQYLELGRSVGLRQVPERVKVLERIMAEVVADARSSAAPARSN